MPAESDQIVVALQREQVWEYIQHFSNWASAMPGLVAFQQEDDQHSLWQLKGDLGMMQRVVHFQVTVTKREPPGCMEFSLAAPDDGVSGKGVYTGVEVPGGTSVTLELSLEGTGMTKPLVDVLLRQMLRRDLPKLVGEVARHLQKTDSISTPNTSVDSRFI